MLVNILWKLKNPEETTTRITKSSKSNSKSTRCRRLPSPQLHHHKIPISVKVIFLCWNILTTVSSERPHESTFSTVFPQKSDWLWTSYLARTKRTFPKKQTAGATKKPTSRNQRRPNKTQKKKKYQHGRSVVGLPIDANHGASLGIKLMSKLRVLSENLIVLADKVRTHLHSKPTLGVGLSRNKKNNPPPVPPQSRTTSKKHKKNNNLSSSDRTRK